MRVTYYLTAMLLSMSILGCEKDNTEAKVGIIGEWKLIEEKIGSGLIDGQSVLFEPVQSSKIIIFSSDGTYQSNGEMCQMSNQVNNQTTGFFYEPLNSIEPQGCQSTAPTSGIHYELNGDILLIEYPCYEECQQKYSRI